MPAKLLKISVIVAAPVMILLVLFLILLASSPGEGRVRQWLERKFADQTGLEVAVGRFETNIWSRVQLGGMALMSRQADVSDTLLYLHSAKINYSLIDLLFGETRLKSVVIDSVDLRVSMDSLGRTGVQMLDSEAADSIKADHRPVIIHINSFSLLRLNLGYTDSRVPLKVELFDASAHIKATDATTYAGLLNADSICADYDNLPICATDLLIDAVWNGADLRVNSAAAEIAGLTWQSNGSLSGPNFDNMAFEMSLQGGPGTLAGILGEYLGFPELEVKELYLNAVGSGSIADPDINLRLSMRDANINNVAVSSMSIGARYESDTLTVNSMRLSALDGSFDGHGYVLTDGSFETSFRLDIKRTNLAELWSAIYGEVSPYSGFVYGDLLVSGSGKDIFGWRLQASINASKMRYRDRPIPDAEFGVSFEDNTARLRILNEDNRIRAIVRIQENDLKGDFDIDIPCISSLAGFLNFPGLSGRIGASGTISGTMDNPLIIASADGSQIRYLNFPVDSLQASIRYQENLFFVDNLALSGQLEHIDPAAGLLGIDSISGGFRFDCEANGPLDSLGGMLTAGLISPGYGGFKADSANIRIAFDGPRIALDHFDLSYDRLILQAAGVFDTTAAKGSLDVGLWTVESLLDDIDTANSQDFSRMVSVGEITSTFSLPDDIGYVFQIHGRDIRTGLAGIIAKPAAAIDGYLDFDMLLSGSQTDPAGRLSAAVRSIDLQGVHIDSVLADAILEDGRLSLESLDLFAPHRAMSAAAAVELKRAPDGIPVFDSTCAIVGNLSINDFDLKALVPFMTSGGLVSGSASARLSWNGTLTGLQPEGWLTLSDGAVRLTEESTPAGQIHLQISLSDSILGVDSASFIVARIPVSIRGTIEIQSRDAFYVSLESLLLDVGRLSAEGRISQEDLDLRIATAGFDLSVLTPFLVEFDSLGGILTSNVFIKGQPGAPEITGTLTISDASLYSPKYLLGIDAGMARLAFDRRRVEIDSLSFLVNGGPVVIKGSIEHDLGEITDINMNLYASGLKLQKPGLFLINLNHATLAFKRRDDHYVLDGDIRLGEARLIARFRPQSILPWARTVEAVDWEVPDLLSRTRLNVRIRESENLWVDNNLARIRMRAEVEIVGTPARPNLTGLIDVKEGYLLYLDRRFRVTQGTVHLADPLKFNPDILLLANTQISAYQRTAADKYTVFIKAEGRLDQLQADLYSEPSLDKSDIVALLTLGATRTQLAGRGEDQGNGGLKNALVNRAAMLTSRRVSGYMSDKVGSIFGFDEVTVEGNLFQFDKSWGPHLVASRRLSERLELTYSTTVGHLNDQAIRLGYRLRPRLSLEGETDRYGQAGIDLKYGIRFR